MSANGAAGRRPTDHVAADAGLVAVVED
eukprot:SAG11_NODE_25814_length_353_cov_1.295276_1_plen_27_part_10